MRNLIMRATVLVTLASLTLQLDGCSVVMFTVGSAIDRSEASPKEVSNDSLNRIRSGAQVVVIRLDSSKVAGKFVHFADSSNANDPAAPGAISKPEFRARAVIVVATDSSTVAVPLSDVAGIWARNHTHYKWVMLGVGLAVDIAAVLTAVVLSHMEIMGGGSWGYIPGR
jgi:hypothetical protein